MNHSQKHRAPQQHHWITGSRCNHVAHTVTCPVYPKGRIGADKVVSPELENAPMHRRDFPMRHRNSKSSLSTVCTMFGDFPQLRVAYETRLRHRSKLSWRKALWTWRGGPLVGWSGLTSVPVWAQVQKLNLVLPPGQVAAV
jgi:hypothetical protein